MGLRDITAGRHLQNALDDIAAEGRYWPGAMTRQEAAVLEQLVRERGHGVLVHEFPPEWEYVVALSDSSLDELREIARGRARLRE